MMCSSINYSLLRTCESLEQSKYVLLLAFFISPFIAARHLIISLVKENFSGIVYSVTTLGEKSDGESSVGKNV